MKKIHLKVWRDIGRQRWQFLALIVIILLGVTSYGGMIGMIDDVERSLDRTLDELAFQDVVIRLEGTVPAGLAQEVAGLDPVEAATGRLVLDAGLAIGEGNYAHARLVGMPREGQPPVNQLYIREGRYLRPGDELMAVLDHHVADYYGYGPGAVLHPVVRGERLDVEVVGIGVSPEYLMAVESSENPMPSPSGFAVLFMPQEAVAGIYGAPGEINELNLRFDPAAREEVDRAIAQVEGALSGVTVRSVVRRADNPSYSLLMMDLEGGREMMNAVPSIFLTVAALSIYVFLSRMVQAQRAQIGVVKAMGYTRWAVLRHYLLFSALVALVGAVLGFALSYPVGLAFSRAYAAEFGLPFVVVEFHWASALQGIAITLFFCLLAGFFPAWTSAQMRPAQAIRFDPSIALVEGSVPLLERLLRPLVRLRTGTKVALRNVFRNRRRSLTTLLGFVFAFVVLLACWAMFDALGYMLELHFEQVTRWDMRATFNQPQIGGGLPDEVAGWPGVEAVEAVIEFPATLRSGEAEEDLFVMAIDPQTSMRDFPLPRGQEAADLLSPRTILISPQIADKLGVASGDEVTVQTIFGKMDLTVEASNEEVMSAVGFVSLPWLRQMAGGQEIFTGLLLKVDEGGRDDVRRRLYQVPGMGSVGLKEEMMASWEELMGLYYVMMGLFLLFALIIAGAVIFNTMTVNVLERWREIATMRALGQSSGKLAGMITKENMLIGLLSLVPGLGLGYGATYYLFGIFTASADFYLPMYIAPTSYIIVTGLIFATALLSQIPAIRRVNRMDLAEATKVRT